jgi:DNA-binding GntR family transcriptional regulator
VGTKIERRNTELRRQMAQHYKRLEDCLTEREIARELGVSVDVVRRLEKEEIDGLDTME